MQDIQEKNLEQWLHYLESLHPSKIDLGLERIRTVAERVGIEKNATVVTVAGTNGKGSCIHTLESILRLDQLQVGTYTSPHLFNYSERITINGVAVADEIICACFAEIEEQRGDISLTYFEFGTLAALLIFQAAQLDIWLLETGMGGRLDAVNIIDPDIAIVTHVDLDHENWLGHDREAQGREKAGIFRSQRWAICGDHNPPNTLLEHAETLGAGLLLNGQDFSFTAATVSSENQHSEAPDSESAKKPEWTWQGKNLSGNCAELSGLPEPPLAADSIACAIQAASLIGGFPDQQQLAGLLAALSLKGRFHFVQWQGKRLCLDVAHNPSAVAQLIKQLDNARADSGQIAENAKIHALFAVMADKNIAAMLALAEEKIDHWHVAGLAQNDRAAGTEALARQLRMRNLQFTEYDTVEQALPAACKQLEANDVLLVFGSFFTVTAALQIIEGEG